MPAITHFTFARERFLPPGLGHVMGRRLEKQEVDMDLKCGAFTFALLASIAATLPVAAQQARQRGWDAMCQRNDQPFDFCVPHAGPRVVGYTPELADAMRAVNHDVNRAYRYSSDSSEYWTVPRGGTADCEDFVLAKIAVLGEMGFPVSAMSIVVGRMWNGRWHAVLVIDTDAGAVALDSMHNELVAPGRVGMRGGYTMSMTTPGHWVAFD